MIDVTIEPRIAEAAPQLVLGLLRARVRTAPGSDALWKEMQLAAQQAAADATEPSTRAPIAATRELYRRLGKDPSRYRGSPEALLRRARSGKELYRIHNVVDVINQARAINDRPVVIDFVVGADAQVWPMVAAGTSNDEIQAARGIRPLFDDPEEGHA